MNNIFLCNLHILAFNLWYFEHVLRTFSQSGDTFQHDQYKFTYAVFVNKRNYLSMYLP